MEKLIDLMNERIDKIENLIAKEITSIETELKELRALYSEMVKIVSRLSCIEERCNVHRSTNERLYTEIEDLKKKFTELHTRLSPVEEFFKSFREIKNKVIATILVNIILGAFGLYVIISSVIDKFKLK